VDPVLPVEDEGLFDGGVVAAPPEELEPEPLDALAGAVGFADAGVEAPGGAAVERPGSACATATAIATVAATPAPATRRETRATRA